MATISRIRPHLPESLLAAAAPAPIAPAALLLVAMAAGGLGLTVLGRPPTAPEAPPPATVTETEAADLPRGDLPIIGDPIRDLTIWWSNRLTDANRAGLDSLRGRALTPIDPMADDVIKTLYGKILLITIPLLTLGGMILGYLIMTSRTTGESAYTARAVTPRFVVGATLSVLGIFLASVLAQFVTATDLAMVGVSIPGNAVGGSDAWPAAGGVFEVLQKASFDPRITRGPEQLERRRLAVGRPGGDRADDVPPDGQRGAVGGRAPAHPRRPDLPRRLRAASDPADHERLAQGPPRDPRRPVRLDDRLRPLQPRSARAHRPRREPADRRRYERAARPCDRLCAAHVRAAVRAHPGRHVGAGTAPDRDMNERGLVEVPENAVRDEPIAFGLTAVQLGICALAVVVAAILNVLPIWEPIRLVLVVLGAGPIALAAALPVRGEPAYRWIVRASPIPPRFAVLERNTREPR